MKYLRICYKSISHKWRENTDVAVKPPTTASMAFIRGKADAGFDHICLKLKETGILEINGVEMTDAQEKRGAVDAHANTAAEDCK